MNKLAIVIPYYKIDFFEETIRSVANQTSKCFTLYIGNDASPNNPLPIIQKYFKDGDYIYFNYKKNLGRQNLALQWERILQNVEEEWFQILGDDDMISQNFVENINKNLKRAEAENLSLIKYAHQWIDCFNNIIETHNYAFNIINAKDLFFKKYNQEVKTSLSENIFKTALFQKFRFEKLPLAWGTDDISLLTFSNFGKILYIREIMVKVRVYKNSISGSSEYDHEKLKALLLLREVILTKFQKHFELEELEKILDDYIYTCYKNKICGNFKVSQFYINRFQPLKFFKTLKKIYQLNQNAS